MKCPHCNNSDSSMIDNIGVISQENPYPLYVYFCRVCSKTWTERKDKNASTT